MEYRLKYRDIPWYVAFIVLPGKILGTVFIKWPLRFAESWERNVITIGLCLLAVIAIMSALYFVSDGEVNLFTALLRIIGINI